MQFLMDSNGGCEWGALLPTIQSTCADDAGI